MPPKATRCVRYNVVDRLRAEGASPPAAGCTSGCSKMPAARELDGLPIATVKPRAAGAARGLHLRGLPQRRRLGRHAQHPGHHARPCSAWPAWSTSRCSASRPSCCRSIPNVDDVVGAGAHATAAAWRSTRPDAIIPIRTLRNISLNPNFGGEVMVVSLGCEKLQPERLLPPGTIRDRRRAQRGRRRRQRRRQARRRLPAGRGARRLHVDDRLDHGDRPRSTSSA